MTRPRIATKPLGKPTIEPSYLEYLGWWDPHLKYGPYPRLENVFFAAARTNAVKPNLLKPGTQIKPLSPKFGSVVEGVQLSALSPESKDELVLRQASQTSRMRLSFIVLK